jgi:hypothetical protein
LTPKSKPELFEINKKAVEMGASLWCLYQKI